MPYQQSLTPEQMQQLLSSQGWGYGAQNIGGMTYGRSGIEHTDEGGNSFDLNGFQGFDPNAMKPGDSYMQYGKDGSQAGLGTILDGGKTNASDFKDFGQMVMTLAPMAIGGALAGGAFGGAGTAAANLGDLDLMYGGGADLLPGGSGVAGSTLGGGGSFTGAGMDASLTGGTSAFDGGGGNYGGSGDYNPGAMGPTTSAQTAASDAQLATQLDPYYAGPSAGGGNWLTSLLGGGSGGFGSLAGPAATLLGGLLGSKGQTQSQTRDIPEWMKPYVTGAGGLLPGAQSLFAKQTAPGAMPGYQQMQTVGQGLLSQPIAGNGVAQFQAMPRFGGK